MTTDEETLRFRAAMAAIKAQDLASIRRIFSERPSYLLERTHLGSWIEYAATHRAHDSARMLIELGLSPNFTPDPSGRLPISSAAMQGDVEMVKLLIERGSELKTDKTDYNPLFSAIRGGHNDVVRLLIEHGVDPLIRYGSKQGDAIAFALECHKLETAELMAEMASGGDNQRKQEILAYALMAARAEGPLKAFQIMPSDDDAG